MTSPTTVQTTAAPSADDQTLSPAFTIYDLHSHTTASDGYLTPEALVSRAVEMRVGVLAITDHDSTEGLARAAQAIAEKQLPLVLINGVEISTLWENHEIHIVGLGIDPQHPAMVNLLSTQADLRQQRAQEMGHRLAKARIEGAWEGALRLAQGGAVTRAHFARYLVEVGAADNIAQVFKKFLAKGKTGYVPHQVYIEQAIDVFISQADSRCRPSGALRSFTKWLKGYWRILRSRAVMRWKSRSVREAPNERARWRPLHVIISCWPRRDLISISPVRGLSLAANFGFAGVEPVCNTGRLR